MSRVVFDPRGFRYTFFLERFNKVTSTANTSVDKYLVDVHLEVMASYLCLLLEFLVPQRCRETYARTLLDRLVEVARYEDIQADSNQT